MSSTSKPLILMHSKLDLNYGLFIFMSFTLNDSMLVIFVIRVFLRIYVYILYKFVSLTGAKII